MAPIIRRATKRDLESLGRLGALMVEQHHQFDEKRFLAPTPHTVDAYAAFLGTQLENPAAVLLVVEDAARVVGYAYAAIEGYDYVSLRGPAALLHDLIVDPAFRGRGAGRALLEATLSALAAQHVPRVVLSSAERNEPAQRFFARMGFRRTMVEMTRELDGETS
jgi:ribosomal protein S18 acetylase RimI-like enzyme